MKMQSTKRPIGRSLILFGSALLVLLTSAAPALACGDLYGTCWCPTTSATIESTNDDGIVTVRVKTRPDPSFAPSRFNVYFPDLAFGCCPVTQDPEFVRLNTQCMTEPRELKLVPVNCFGDEFPSQTWGPVTIAPTATEPKVSLTVDKGFDPQANRIRRKGIVTWDLGLASSNWVVRVHLLPWKTADGNTYSGAEVWRPAATTRTGTGEFFFDTPGGTQQIVLRALAESCVGRDTKDVPVDCGCEENASSADPVYFKDGNVRVYDSDPLPPIAGQVLARTYNSDEQVVALFGRGWTTLFERRLILNTDGGEQVVSLMTGTNEVVTFRGSGNTFRQTWPTARSSDGVLAYDAGTGTYAHRAAGSNEIAIFRASDGRLLVLRDSTSGREARIGYDSQGLPQSLSDSWSGTNWVLTIDAPNRRISSIGVSGRPDLTWSYSYDGAGNLRNVTAPGSTAWRTYEYNANRMTASYDPSGNLIESHAYDANGYGISSTGPGDEIDAIEYDLPGSVAGERVTRVTYKTGATAEYALRPAGGAYRPVRVTGGCSSCGASDATYVHDREGRVIREQGPDGYITVTTYEGAARTSEERFLSPADCDPATDTQQCRLSPDALESASLRATSATVLSTYTYGDPVWPDRVTAVATPSVFAPGRTRRESHSYHPRSGALAGTSVVGWSGQEPGTDFERTTSRKFYGDATVCDPRGEDGCPGTGSDDGLTPLFAPGGSFDGGWLSLPQPARLVKSVDGPRSDVQDVTSFVYYPIHSSVPALLRGQLAATKNAAGHMTHYESYDLFGNATRVVDANGVASEAAFDALGRPVTSTLKGVAGCSSEPLCGTDLVTTRSYAAAGPLLTEVRPGGAVTSYTYDGRGRVRTLSRGPSATDLREQVEYSYDPLTGKKSGERMLARENGAWVEKRRESFTYDGDARLQTVTHADGAAVHYTFDADDRVATVRDENHASANTFYKYNPAGRLARVTQTLAGASGGVITTDYGYDLHGNLTSVTDPNGNVTSYVYNDFGELTSQVSPVTGTTTYVYDAAGNLKEVTDANTATTVRVHDALGRVTSATSTRGLETETVSWSYDDTTAGRFAIGRLSSMSDPSGTTAYHYERRGLLREETHAILGSAYVQRYGYDADGNRVSIGYPSGRTVTYTVDHSGRPLSASGTIAGQTTSYVTAAAYLPFGPLMSLTLGNGTTETRTFTTRYLPLATQLTHGATTLAHYVHTNDPAGNITVITDATNAAYNRTFGYDDLHRLTTANSGNALWGTGSFTWDRMGNMLSATLGGAQRTFTHQGTTPRINTATGLAGNMTYDGAGNELKGPAGQPGGGMPAAVYSPRNLVQSQFVRSYDRCVEELGSACTQPDPVEEWGTHVYDGRGVRVLSTRTIVAGIVSIDAEPPPPDFYFYTPELSMLNIVSPTTGRTADVIWFGSRPVADHGSDGPRYTFTDHLGTPILQTTSTASVIWRVEYEPFGKVHTLRTGSDAADQPLRFPGQQVAYRTATGEENYNIFRWYRAGWGRYTQSDPILRTGVRTEYHQDYGYVLQNPSRYIDPWGLYSIDINCFDCKGADPKDQKNLANYLMDGVSAWCNTKLASVTNIQLKKCMADSCNNGKITCEEECEPGVYGYAPGVPGNALGHWLATKFPKKTATVCASADGNFGVAGGETVIHEWAHGCGCNSDIPGNCVGIPGLPTAKGYLPPKKKKKQ